MSVAILGAGITGLATAYLLRREGVPVTVYEAGSAAGGLAASFEHAGFAFDYGPHEFCTDNPRLIALLHEICAEDLLTIEKHTAQHFCGRYVRYPFEIADVLRNIGLRLSLRAMFEVAACRLRNALRAPKDDSFRAWTEARFGKTLYDLYFGPYTEKVWGMDPTLLDPRTASQRITIDSVWDLLKKTLAFHWLGTEDWKRAHSEFRKRFFYTRGGIGTLQRRLRDRFLADGGRIEFGRTLAGVERIGNRVTALHFADGSTARGFDQAVSTIPLPTLVRLVHGSAADELLRREVLPFRGMAFVFVRVARPEVLGYHWVYYPDREVPFQRLTESAPFRAGMAPEGCTGLTLEVSCVPGDNTWSRPDAEIAAECVDTLVRLGHLRPAEVLGWDVVRTTHAYPLQVQGFQEKTERLLDSLAVATNLLSIGRQGLFRYCNMNECVEMALAVVPDLVQGRAAIRYTRANTWEGVALTDRALAKPRVS